MTAPPNARGAGRYHVRILDRDLTSGGLGQWWNGLPGPRRSVMLRSEYLSTWADAFLPDEARLHTPVVFAGGAPVAALPLYRRRGVLCSLANDAHADVFDGGVDPAHPEALDRLVDVLTRRRLRLERLDGASAVFEGLWRAAPPMIVDRCRSPRIDVPATPDALLATLSSKFRAGVRRAVRVLATLGTVTMREYRSGDADLGAAYTALLDLEAASWKGARGTAIARCPDTASFYRRIALDGPASRWARVALLRVDDRVVAAQLDLERDGARDGLKMACVTDLGRGQSPGTVLLWHVLADCATRGVTRFGLGGELDGWKCHWTSVGDERIRVRTWPRTMRGELTYGAREQVKQVVRPLRRGLRPPPGSGRTARV